MTKLSQTLPADPPVSLAASDVETFLTMMGKSLRAFNMYQANNPVFQRFREGLRTSIEDLWRKVDRVDLIVQEDGFSWGDAVFTVGKGRDSLAFAFYKDGVRFLTFFPGFEDEVNTFLELVNRAMRHDAAADDLITVLWEEDFASLQYGYVDLLTEGLSVPEEPRGATAAVNPGAILSEAEAGESETREAAGATGALTAGVTLEDFDETVYFLDQSEMAALQTEVEIEMERDLREDVLNALFDRLEESGRRQRQAEILDILDQLLPLFLSRGHLDHAARILQELDRLVTMDDPLDDALRERVERLFDRLSDPEVLEQFVQAIEDGAVSPDADEVNLFFSRLHPQALPVLIRFSEMAETPGVRGRLSSAIDGLATRYPTQAGKLLQSDEPALVRGAARAAGRVGLGQAVPGLHAVLAHADRDIRMAVVEALVSIRLTPALHALTDALDDSDRDVRVAAAQALGAVRFASARERLTECLGQRRLKHADLTEKMAFYEAFGAIGGSAAVERLDTLLNRKGFMGRRPPSEDRACAALGLGQAATPAAREALEKAREDGDPIVRNTVHRALRLDEGG
ncbi:MAG TPA: HEAT repeat domain-containing protein [Longimicrobiales bacterium]|nr:HEAT repeat domain-containing protein [Longimicrobiales bacterium]